MSEQVFEIEIPESALAAVGAKSADEFVTRIVEIRERVKAVAARVDNIQAEVEEAVAFALTKITPEVERQGAEIARLQAIVDAIPTGTPETIAKVQAIAGDAAELRCMQSIPSYLPPENL